MALPLPTLTFYRMPDASPSGTTLANFWDALYTALTSATDYRGTALPASHVWSFDRFQNVGITEAVYTTAPPVGTPMTMSPAIIFAGDSAGSAVTMASPDTTGANALLVGLNKQGGAYSGWKTATPFGSGSFFGYWRCGRPTALAAGTVIRAFISQETILVQIVEPTVTNQTWVYVGATVEPHTNDTTNAAESDNRLYGQITSGTTAIGATWLTQASSAGSIFSSSTSNGQVHNGVFVPNTGAIVAGGRCNIMLNVTASTLQEPSGQYVGSLMEWAANTGSFLPAGNRYGTIRGLFMAGVVQSGRYLRNGVTDLYHYVSPDLSGAVQGMMITAAP